MATEVATLLDLPPTTVAVNGSEILETIVDNTSVTITAQQIANIAITAAAQDAQQRVTAVIGGAPTNLNTLNKLALAIGSDPNYATTVTAALSGKVNSSDLSANTGATLVGSVLPAGGNGTVQQAINALNATDVAAAANLANNTDMNKGISLVGRGVVAVPSVVTLQTVKQDSTVVYEMNGYYAGTTVGGDRFIWNPSRPKSAHNGGTIISPTVPWNGTQATLAAFLNGTGETTPAGNGCFERIVSTMTARCFGAVGNNVANDLAAWVKVVSRLTLDFNEINGEELTYYVGPITVNEAALMTLQTKFYWKIIGMPRFRVDNQLTTSPSLQYTSIFDVIDCQSFYIEADSFGDVFDKDNATGPVTVNLRSVNISVRGGQVKAKCSKGLAALQTRRQSPITTKRLTTDPIMEAITYDVESIDCEYGVRFVGTGDHFMGNIRTQRVGRSYFATGVSNHIAMINSASPYLVSDVLVKAYADSIENFFIFLNEKNANGAAWPVTIEHQNDTGDTTVNNVHLWLNITNRANPRVFITGETTREYVRVGSVFNLAGTMLTSTTCVTDNIFIYGEPKSFSIVSGIRDSILNLPTATTNPGRIHIEFEDTQRSTKGFTIVKGGKLKGKVSGSLTSNPARIDLRNCWPSGGAFRVDTHINADYTDTNMPNSLTRGDILLISMDSTGTGSVVTTSALYSISRGTAPTVTYTISAGQLVATGAGSTAANTEMCVVVEPLAGRFL